MLKFSVGCSLNYERKIQMFQVSNYRGDKTKDYEIFQKQLNALIENENDEISCLSNVAALFNMILDNINRVGFYM